MSYYQSRNTEGMLSTEYVHFGANVKIPWRGSGLAGGAVGAVLADRAKNTVDLDPEECQIDRSRLTNASSSC